MERSRLAVVGLGRIGLATAVSFARGSGRAVVGVERDAELLSDIRAQELSYDEPGVLGRELAKLELRASIDELDCSTIDAWIICVGSNEAGRLDPSGVLAVARSVVARARSGAVVVIESTVPPGTSDALADVRPDVLVAHCPERGAPGRLIEELSTQPRLIGGTSPEAAQAARELYEDICTGELILCAAREAELAKLVENAYRAVNVAFANELARTARGLQLDSRRIIELANSHARVEILRPGLGAGGDCLPMATRWFAERDESGVAAGAARVDAGLPGDVVAAIHAEAPGARAVVILGTAYKPNVAYAHDPQSDERTPAGRVFDALEEAAFEVRSWDGLRQEDDDVAFAAAVEGADVVVFGCAHERLAELDPSRLLRLARGSLAVDFVGAVDAARWRSAGWRVLR